MDAPDNPYRKGLANLYMERYMGQPVDDFIKKAINGEDDEKSLDYYIAAEKLMPTMMLTYVSFEIERFSAMKNEN